MNKIIFIFIISLISAVTCAASEETGTYTRISKQKDYGLMITRLVVDLGEGSKITEKDISEDTFQVTGFGRNDTKVPTIKKISVTNKRGLEIESGRYVTIDLDFSFDSDPSNSYTYTVMLNKDLGTGKKGKKFEQQGRTLRR